MGVAYNVISASVVDRYSFAVVQLRAHHMSPPSRGGPGRPPSPQDLRAVLDDLPGYRTEYDVTPGNWQAEVAATTGLWLFRSSTLVSVVDYQGDERMPHLFYFEKGDPKLNLLIVEGLSRLCGPLYVFPDTGARPLLVTPGLNPTDATKVWERG